ncbi:hypothetical protein V1478_007007 [Vespula squamosa]|uniref:Uncharacterized protein n=1 Tax=Vespula squamosa TaxID=30214 RepID=A0ABD2B1Y6_VESSQ
MHLCNLAEYSFLDGGSQEHPKNSLETRDLEVLEARKKSFKASFMRLLRENVEKKEKEEDEEDKKKKEEEEEEEEAAIDSTYTYLLTHSRSQENKIDKNRFVEKVPNDLEPLQFWDTGAIDGRVYKDNKRMMDMKRRNDVPTGHAVDAVVAVVATVAAMVAVMQATEWDTYDTLTLTSFCNRHEDIIETDRIELRDASYPTATATATVTATAAAIDTTATALETPATARTKVVTIASSAFLLLPNLTTASKPYTN